MCVHECVYVYVCVRVPDINLRYLPQLHPPCFWDTAPHWELELTDWLCWAGPVVPGILLSLSLQSRYHKHIPSRLDFLFRFDVSSRD